MKMKRVLSLLLALVMTMSLLTLPTYAADETDDTATSVVEVAHADGAIEDELRTITNGVVTVRGAIPENVALRVTEMPESREVAISDDASLVKLDITLYYPDGTEWQPAEGQTVEVTLNAEAYDLPEGLRYDVLHIHENEDGTSAEELLGPYTVSDGEAVFDLTSFSYVIIIVSDKGTTTIEDVQSFYTVSGTAGNDHIHASGVYFTTDGNAHLLLTSDQSHASSCWASTVEISTIEKPISLTENKTKNYSNVTRFELQNGENTEDITNLLSGLKNKESYVIDIDLGKISLREAFTVSVTWNNGKINGFAINGMQVTVVFKDGIFKQVHSVNGTEITAIGEIPEVKAGDKIIYKIVVANDPESTQSVTGSVVDILPNGIFDSVYYATDSIPASENDWTRATVDESGRFTLVENITLNKGASKTYYVQATVKDDTAVGTYTNKATFNTREATAVVEVKTPPKGDLTIYKTPAYGTIFDENQSFIFEIKGDSDNAKTKDIDIFVTIQGEGNLTVKDLPVGNYTVTEVTSWSWRYMPTNNNQTVSVQGGQDESVTFANTRENGKWLSGDNYAVNHEGGIKLQGTFVSGN